MICNPGPRFATSALDAINCGLFQFVDGRLSMVNRTGHELLKDGFLSLSGDRIICRLPKINRRLQSYLGQTERTRDTPLILRDPVSKAEYCIRLHRTNMAVESDGRDVLVMTVTLLRQVKPPTLSEVRGYARPYGLSEAEVVVLHAVLANTELRSLAKVRRVHLDTVRKQLKSAMAKIDVHSQKELFALYERFRFCNS